MNIYCRLKRGVCLAVVGIVALMALMFLSGPIRASADTSDDVGSVPVSVQTDPVGTATNDNSTPSATGNTSSSDQSATASSQTDSVNSTQVPAETGTDVNTGDTAESTSSSGNDQADSNQDVVNPTTTKDPSIKPD